MEPICTLGVDKMVSRGHCDALPLRSASLEVHIPANVGLLAGPARREKNGRGGNRERHNQRTTQ